MTSFYALTSYSNSTNKFCSSVTASMIEGINGYTKTVTYDMPWCVKLLMEVELVAEVSVSVRTPDAVSVTSMTAFTHPSLYNDESQIIVEFSTQVRYPWKVNNDSFSWNQFEGTQIVSDTTVVESMDEDCTTRVTFKVYFSA